MVKDYRYNKRLGSALVDDERIILLAGLSRVVAELINKTPPNEEVFLARLNGLATHVRDVIRIRADLIRDEVM